MGLSIPDNELDVLRPAKRDLDDYLEFIQLSRVSTGKGIAMVSRAAETLLLEERTQVADVYFEVLRVPCVHYDKQTAKCEYLTTGTAQTKAKRDASADCICEWDVDATTGNTELGVNVQAVQSLNKFVAAGKLRINTA